MKIFGQDVKVEAKTILGVAGMALSLVGMVISDKQKKIESDEMVNKSAEKAAKILAEMNSKKED